MKRLLTLAALLVTLVALPASHLAVASSAQAQKGLKRVTLCHIPGGQVEGESDKEKQPPKKDEDQKKGDKEDKKGDKEKELPESDVYVGHTITVPLVAAEHHCAHHNDCTRFKVDKSGNCTCPVVGAICLEKPPKKPAPGK